jgi:hypothetical protein
MDTVGNKVAKAEIAMIKVAVPAWPARSSTGPSRPMAAAAPATTSAWPTPTPCRACCAWPTGPTRCTATRSASWNLFKQEVGAPFRSFRTWKRARSLLHYVNRDANLAHVALDTGYPDSTHFSHSIRQVYGLKPKDIFAGSRRLAIYAQA